MEDYFTEFIESKKHDRSKIVAAPQVPCLFHDIEV